MRKNKKRKVILHSAMRGNRISKISDSKRKIAIAILGVLAISLIVASYIGYMKLHSICNEQCELKSIAKQISITTGETIKADTIFALLGIREGINLAEIDFTQKHRDAMKKAPNIKNLTIVRRLPNRLEIHVEERSPIAKMEVRGNKKSSGRVVDRDGVVFSRSRGVSLLPTIFESRSSITKPGEKLQSRIMAALTLLEIARDEFQELGILSVDTTNEDYLFATLSNYSSAKIAWENMDNPTSETNNALRSQLKHLQSAMKTAGNGVKVWNITLPNRATGDTKEPIL